MPSPEHARTRVMDLDLWRAMTTRTRAVSFAQVLPHPRAWTPEADRFPALHLEDVSGIPFIKGVPGVAQYQQRARVRASDGELVACVVAPAPGYEAYCQRLGLGAPQWLQPEGGDDPLEIARGCMRGDTLNTLATRARDAGGLVIHPYMAIEPVWALAEAIAQASGGADVRVLGPTVDAVWIANDKGALDALAHALELGDIMVETHRATTAQALTRAVITLASRHDRVGLKRTRCASAMGNQVLSGPALRAMSEDEVARVVQDFLARTEWPEGQEEVLAVQWVQASASPSTQLWIPHPEQGPPRVEGIYEQLLEGEEQVFLGSRPSTLSEAIHDALADASLRIGTAFQALGYVGRCSFDFVVSGPLDAPEGWRAWMTECNGRWGGTSTPMRLVERVVAGPRPHYIAQDFMRDALVGLSFEALLEATRDHAYDPRTGQGRFLFYNVGPLLERGKFDVVSLGRTPDEAREGVETILPRCLGV